MTLSLAEYFDRYDPTKNYEQWLFRAGNALQSAEANEIQSLLLAKLKGIGDASFTDGNIINGCDCVVNATTGAVQMAAGSAYVSGAIRSLAASTFTVSLTGTVTIGIWLISSVVTEAQDPTLLDPATTTQNYNQPGAGRLEIAPQWGFSGDGTVGDFYPVYYVDSGYLRTSSSAPSSNTVNQAIAQYDVDSNGSNYVVSGLAVTQMSNDSSGNQVYNVDSGSARINGYAVKKSTATRLTYGPTPDLKAVGSEPFISTNAVSQVVSLDVTPLNAVQSAMITTQTTESIIHGSVVGSVDPLTYGSVVSIVSVTQGSTTYVPGTDYQLTRGEVDWSPGGAEPLPGSTYTVTYQHIISATPTNVTENGYTVAGAVVGTQILTTYTAMLPRIDRLCVNSTGAFVWITGVANEYTPIAPAVPSGMLELAQIYQAWTSTGTYVTNDGVRMVSMYELENMQNQISTLYSLVAQINLSSNAMSYESAASEGIFTDAFSDNSKRDDGVPNTAAVVSNALALAINGTANYLPNDVLSATSCAWTHNPVISNSSRTSSSLINPYMAFAAFPGTATLTPAVDRWTGYDTVWATAQTQEFISYIYDPYSVIHGSTVTTSASTSTETLGSSVTEEEYLRQIPVAFALTGFGYGETLSSVKFDGISVTPTGSLTGDVNGNISGTFTIPANVQAGTKSVAFTGSRGGNATASFTGQGEMITVTEEKVTTIDTVYLDPLAETFTLDSSYQLSGIDLWFTAVGTTQVKVQIRETSVGFPTQTVLAEAALNPSQITAGQWTRFVFNSPYYATADTEYAIVVMCNDATAAVAIAQMGQYDSNAGQYVTSQPYAGVMLTSSNASTWSAQQTEDLTFRLLARSYSATTETVDLGTLAVTGVTDLIISAMTEEPATGAGASIQLTMPDGTIINTTNGGVINLSSAVTGNIDVKAILTATANAGAILYPGSEIITGILDQADVYESVAVIGNSAGCNIRVIFDAILPSGSTASVYVASTATPTVFTLVPSISATVLDAQNGVYEYQFYLSDFVAAQFKLKINIAGSASARPFLFNLRSISTAH